MNDHQARSVLQEEGKQGEEGRKGGAFDIRPDTAKAELQKQKKRIMQLERANEQLKKSAQERNLFMDALERNMPIDKTDERRIVLLKSQVA